MASVISGYGSFYYGISPEGRRPQGNIDLQRAVRDQVLANVQFLEVLLEGFTPGKQTEICLALIRPAMLLIGEKMEYAKKILRVREYPEQKWVKTGDHFPSKEEAEAFFRGEIIKDANFVLAVWKYFEENVFPNLDAEAQKGFVYTVGISADLKEAKEFQAGDFVLNTAFSR